MIKILYTGIRKENYNPKRGMSFEYNNFYLTLRNMEGVEVIEHPYDRIFEVGRTKFNEELFFLIEKYKPDFLFAFMYTDELDSKTLSRIKQKTNTKSIAWFADDYWRFFNYSKYWASYFDFVVTTYSRAVTWYKKAGFENVLYSQWACNTTQWKPIEIKKDIEVSFIGQYKPQRKRIIRALEQAGISVEVYGHGWQHGKVSHEKMLEIINRSKINLNLNARPGLLSPNVLARVFFKKSLNRIVPDFHFINNIRSYFHFPTPHTHARPFEFAGCRAFVISGTSEDIGNFYKEDKEMVFYVSEDELVKKIKYYLSHDEEREAIAKAAYERTFKEHTYEKRFQELFSVIGK